MSVLLSNFLCFGSNEISDPMRTIEYIRAGLAGPNIYVSLSHTCATPGDLTCTACYCQILDDGDYTTPAADDAPWYDGTSEAGEFLGFLATKITLDPVVSRSLTPRGAGSVGGSILGPETLKHRIVAVEGVLVATTPRGMNYGQRWLYDVTRGSGCDSDELVVLPACPEAVDLTQTGSEVDYDAPVDYDSPINYDGLDLLPALDESVYRHLLQVGLVDGPNFEQVVQKGCELLKASFQFAAGIPYLHAPEVTLYDSLISPGQAINLTIPVGEWRYEAAVRITIRSTAAAGSSSARNIRIKLHPLATGETFDQTYHNPCVDLTVSTLAAGQTIVIDATDETVELIDPSSGQASNGYTAMSFERLMTWPVVSNCTNGGLSVWYDRSTGPNIAVKIESILREL